MAVFKNNHNSKCLNTFKYEIVCIMFSFCNLNIFKYQSYILCANKYQMQIRSWVKIKKTRKK